MATQPLDNPTTWQPNVLATQRIGNGTTWQPNHLATQPLSTQRIGNGTTWQRNHLATEPLGNPTTWQQNVSATPYYNNSIFPSHNQNTEKRSKRSFNKLICILITSYYNFIYILMTSLPSKID